jgi:hypothetical protein
MKRQGVLSWAVLLLAGCAPLYPKLPEGRRPVETGPAWRLEIQTETPPGIAEKAFCAMRLLEKVRADPGFAQALAQRTYNFTKDSDEAVRSVDGVLECAIKRPINIPWRLRHCHWPDALNKEYGANRHDDGFYIRTYDCRAEEFTVGELAAHLLHEHMHTCGYEDAGGGKNLATYAANEVVVARVGKVNNCASSAAPVHER